MLGTSPQAYYQWQQRQARPAHVQAITLSVVHRIRRQLPRLGTRKLWRQLHKMQLEIGRDYLFKILKSNYLLIRRTHRPYPTTRTNGQPARYPNLLRQQPPTAPGQAWVSDITYLRLGSSHRFLAVVADAFTRRILGYALSHRLDHPGGRPGPCTSPIAQPTPPMPTTCRPRYSVQQQRTSQSAPPI